MQDSASARHGIDHVGIVVPDLEVAVPFFTEQLGAEIVFALPRFQDPTGAAARRLGAEPTASFAVTMLRVGGAAIELVQWWPAPSVIDVSPVRNASAHLALSVADVATEWQRLGALPEVQQLGAPVTFDAGPTPGLTNAFVRTSWGLLIELMSWPRGA